LIHLDSSKSLIHIANEFDNVYYIRIHLYMISNQ
jgi:hypothetical protein